MSQPEPAHSPSTPGAPTAAPAKNRPVGLAEGAIWALIAGGLFAFTRLIIGMIILGMGQSELTRGAENLPPIAAATAGVAGALLWCFLVTRRIRWSMGAVVGLLAGCFSYLG